MLLINSVLGGLGTIYATTKSATVTLGSAVLVLLIIIVVLVVGLRRGREARPGRRDDRSGHRAPRLGRALKKIARKGGVVVLLDGTLIRTRRRTGDENWPNYSGKHKAHGRLFLALTDECGSLVWISAAKPGRSSEITTARNNKITGHLREAGLGALADLGFVGLGDDPGNPVIVTGQRGGPRPSAYRSPEGGEPVGQPRASGERAWLRRPEKLADPHQGPHECPTRDHAAAGAPRTDERRGPPLTDDHLLPITPPTGTSIAAKPHTSPTTSNFKMKCPQ
ncbi:transposase family protein [Streptomyces sp. NPDC002514]